MVYACIGQPDVGCMNWSYFSSPPFPGSAVARKKFLHPCQGKKPPHSEHLRRNRPFSTNPLPLHAAHRLWMTWPRSKNRLWRSAQEWNLTHSRKMMDFRTHNSLPKLPRSNQKRENASCCPKVDLPRDIHRLLQVCQHLCRASERSICAQTAGSYETHTSNTTSHAEPLIA